MRNMTLTGHIRLVRALADHETWICEKFSRGQAWVDLILLANDSDRDAFIKGVCVPLRRGQLAWSQRQLGERWQWKREKVAGFLQWLADRGQIAVLQDNLTTIITLTNYDIYQTTAGPELGEDIPIKTRNPATGGATEGATQVATKATTQGATDGAADGTRNGERGMGKEEGAPGFCPADAEVFAFADRWPGEPATGTPGPIPRAFAARWLAQMLGRREFPPRWQRALVADWRRESVTGGTPFQKNPAAPSGAAEVVGRSKRLDAVRRELRQVTEEIEALDQSGAEIPAALKKQKNALEREREELAV